MRVAVTGATGFIGRHVVAELTRREMETVLICRPGSELPASFAGFEVLLCDVGDPVAGLFESAGRPDVLIHLAWRGLPAYNSLHHFEQELPAQYRFLRGWVDDGLASLLVAGTCFEYGMQSGPLGEENAALPSNPYGFAKNALRQQLEHLRNVTPFHLTWARLFYMYGDGQSANSLLPQLRSAAERGAPTFPMSGGEQLRDYLPVGEVARLLVSLATGAHDNGVVNICSGKPVSVRALVEGWIREYGWKIEPDLGRYPYPAHEPMAFWGDTRKLERCLRRTGLRSGHVSG